MNHFSATEIESLKTLTLDPSAGPYFDPLRSCLRWPDEQPVDVGGLAYEHIIDLWIARSFIHRNLPKENWYSIFPTRYFVEVWEEALEKVPSWPGFSRLKLSEEEFHFLATELSKDPREHF